VGRPRVLKCGALTDLLKPYDAGAMRRFPVSTTVNAVANDDGRVCAAVVEGAAVGQVGLQFSTCHQFCVQNSYALLFSCLLSLPFS
jgi:hypothetical protein